MINYVSKAKNVGKRFLLVLVCLCLVISSLSIFLPSAYADYDASGFIQLIYRYSTNGSSWSSVQYLPLNNLGVMSQQMQQIEIQGFRVQSPNVSMSFICNFSFFFGIPGSYSNNLANPGSPYEDFHLSRKSGSGLIANVPSNMSWRPMGNTINSPMSSGIRQQIINDYYLPQPTSSDGFSATYWQLSECYNLIVTGYTRNEQQGVYADVTLISPVILVSSNSNGIGKFAQFGYHLNSFIYPNLSSVIDAMPIISSHLSFEDELITNAWDSGAEDAYEKGYDAVDNVDAFGVVGGFEDAFADYGSFNDDYLTSAGEAGNGWFSQQNADWLRNLPSERGVTHDEFPDFLTDNLEDILEAIRRDEND